MGLLHKDCMTLARREMEDKTNNNDPLEAILVDGRAKTDRAKELLVSILKPFLEIDRESGELNILPRSYDLPTQEIILVLLCGRLAQKLLDKLPKDQDEKLAQKEVIKILPTVPVGSIKVGLKRLRDSHLIGSEGGKSFVGFQHLEKIKEKLKTYLAGGEGVK